MQCMRVRAWTLITAGGPNAVNQARMRTRAAEDGVVAPPADDGADPEEEEEEEEEEEDPAPPVTALPTVVDTGRRLLRGEGVKGRGGWASRTFSLSPSAHIALGRLRW